MARAAARDLSERDEKGVVAICVHELEPGRVLGRDLSIVLRLQSGEQPEPRGDRNARAVEGVRPGRIRAGADDLSVDGGERLAVFAGASATERDGAACEI